MQSTSGKHPPTSPSTARARSGCLNCRKRRKKCDEQKPSCTRCQKQGDACEWPHAFTFRLGGCVDAQHPSMTRSGSQKRPRTYQDLKIVDVTFGPDGPARARRRLNLVESSADAITESDEVVMPKNPSIERREIVPQSLPTMQDPPNSPLSQPGLQRTGSVSSSRPHVSPDTQAKVLNVPEAMAAAGTLENNPELESTQKWIVSSHGPYLMDTERRQCTSTTSQSIAGSSSLPRGEGSNDGRESLHLDALDYLASKPDNLDFLVEGSSTDRTHPGETLDRGDTRPLAVASSTTGSPAGHPLASPHNGTGDEELHSQLHNFMIRTARNMVLTQKGSTETSPPLTSITPLDTREPREDYTYSSSQLISSHVSEDRYIKLWQNYLDEVAPWLDMFDNDNHWRTTVAHMAQRVNCLQFSLLALSARQQERKHPGSPHTESLSLYQEAIKLIIVQLPTLSTEIIAACVLLCVLEMMCSSSRPWGEHLDGCAILFEAVGINGAVGGVEEALFWTFARMDVYKAFIGDTMTSQSLNRWFISADSMSTAVNVFKGRLGSDNYANYGVFLCAGVVNILSNRAPLWDRSDRHAYATFISRWKAMYDLLEGWYDDRPEEMRPLISIRSSKDNDSKSPFDTILFSTPPGISGNQIYHASMILLLQERPKEISITKSHKSMLWHARQIIGIALCNSDHGALIHGLQPMWIAGKLMSHHSEHKAVLGILESVEKGTGWATSWRARDLQQFWGVDDGWGSADH